MYNGVTTINTALNDGQVVTIPRAVPTLPLHRRDGGQGRRRNQRRSHTPYSRRNGLSIQVTAAVCVVLLVSLVLSLVKIRLSSDTPMILASADLSEGRRLNMGGIRKGALLFGMSPAQQNEFVAKVHYISDIIRSTHRSPQNPKEIAWQIVTESRRANYDPLLVTSLILAESSFRPHARSPKGAVGLMQVKPSTGKYVSEKASFQWQGESQLTDPQCNLQLGIAYLKYLERMFRGNLHNTLVAYNWGPGNLRGALRDGSQSVPSSSITYSRKIQNRYAHWQRDFRVKLPKYQYPALNMARG